MRTKIPPLSIIIPAYQEAARIERTLEQLAQYLDLHNLIDTEVVVVVAESPDGTADLARAKASLFTHFKVVDSGPQVGKGRDVRAGMLEARGAYRLFMDADLATPLQHIADVQKLMAQGQPVIIAVRDLSSSHTGIRRWVSSLGNNLVRAVLLPGITDTQCGFKAFSAEATEELFRRQTILGWGFDMEILAIARQQGYAIAQIAAPDWKDKPHGTFEDAVASAALKTLGELAVIIWNRWSGTYRNKHFTYSPHRK